MIQRVQSLFLLAVTILSGIMLISPITEFYLANGELVKLYSLGFRNVNLSNAIIGYTIPLFITVSIITLLSLTSILLFNKKQLQLKICVFIILLSFGVIAEIAYYYFSIKYHVPWKTSSFSLVMIFPIINIVLTFQAFRAIGRDDQLLKSYDRLR
jgi:hypothetical protein